MVVRCVVLQAPATGALSELERWVAAVPGRAYAVLGERDGAISVELQWGASDAASGHELRQFLPRFLVTDGELRAWPPTHQPQ